MEINVPQLIIDKIKEEVKEMYKIAGERYMGDIHAIIIHSICNVYSDLKWEHIKNQKEKIKEGGEQR